MPGRSDLSFRSTPGACRRSWQTLRKKLPKTQAFTFGVCTCGEDAGHAMKRFSRLYPLSSSYSLVMPNNYIVGSDTDGEDEILKKDRRRPGRAGADGPGDPSAGEGVPGPRGGHGRVQIRPGQLRIQQIRPQRQALLCRRQLQRLRPLRRELPGPRHHPPGGKPVWAAQCYQCLRCINECPQQAIQYGKATAGRHRYTIRAYLPQDEQ